jgi:hypothetical protein
MNPLLAAWNCTPRFTALVSAASTAPDGVPFCQILHGHDGPTIVKLHENGELIGVPLLFCAPDTVAVYVTVPVSGLLGVNVATVLLLSKLTVPDTGFPLESLSVNDAVLGTTACENVAVGVTDTATPVAPALGVTLVTVGGALGVTALDGDEGELVPLALVAVTVKV